MIDQLVASVENVNAHNTELLRLFQTALLIMVLVGASVMVVLLYLWVIRPIDILRVGVQAIREGEFGTQVQAGDVSEFAQLGDGFNKMSIHLQSLYTDLEGQVAAQTKELSAKNNELETLYRTASDLHQTHTLSATSEQFLTGILPKVSAQAGSIRLLDFDRKRMDMLASIGLPPEFDNARACAVLDACLCGQAVQSNKQQPLHFMPTHQHDLPKELLCERSGFNDVAVIPIRYKEQELGILTLYFAHKFYLSQADAKFLQALCTQLGVAIANLRLVEESKQLAVMQERNLMAQGLHDSIAQSLSFLNLQVQMLDSALNNQEPQQIQESLDFIKEGVNECYEDVRELLLNFRTKISKKEFPYAVHALAERFERQTQIPVDTQWLGDGLPLNSEQQLQVIFILQESLSNIRKHAQASKVDIMISNHEAFTMRIRDDGVGFDADHLATLSGEHVGLGIMRERSRRIHAELKIQSQATYGTTVSLTIPYHRRAVS